jgi:protein O-GlcNAc transferase
MLTIVSATTHEEASFHNGTFLGCSLTRLRKMGIDLDLRIVFRNPPTIGLSDLYNRAIEQDRSDRPMLLVHDDVSIEDIFVDEKISLALREFDVIGTAGGDPPVRSPGWYNPQWNPSGSVGHADRNQLDSVLRPQLTYYGQSPRVCNVIDGHFMALIPATIARSVARFDPQFTYNHYDLDFCRSARRAGLRVGTWPIWVVHGSGGGYQTKAWSESAQRYGAKYAGVARVI